MPRIKPFQGIHFNWHKLTLDRTVCPPYDVIPMDLGRRLRRSPYNTIHLELPRGEGSRRYEHAQKALKRWNRDRVLVREARPSFYIVEQRFVLGRKRYKRVGVLGTLGLEEESLKDVVPHEKTLPKPKQDRLRLLRAIKLNTSPIFAIYSDPLGRARRCLERVMTEPPAAMGCAPGPVDLKIWIAGDPAVTEEISAALRDKKLLIADGHHRLEVAKEYYHEIMRDAPKPSSVTEASMAAASSLLTYFCAEEDAGLLVLPTHRVLESENAAQATAMKKCRMIPIKSLAALEKALARHASPYAFGIIFGGGRRSFALASPVGPVRGIRTGLGVEWLAKGILHGVDPQDMRYTHESREALAWARRSGGTALLVKPIKVGDIRRAVDRAGLLPQKSTYFYPKIQAGIVFKETEDKRR